MALYMITGLQGGGKTCFAVNMILRVLQKTRMQVFTNLPLELEPFFVYGWPKDPVMQMDARTRLLVPEDLFVKSQVMWEQYQRDAELGIKVDGGLWIREKKFGPQPPDLEWVTANFWHFKPKNCCIVMDEVYTLWPHDRGTNPELLAYCKQHRHDVDEVYFITHDPRDVSPHIRRSLTGRYDIENTMQVSPFTGIFSGLIVPKQFFKVKRHLREAGQVMESYAFHPPKAIFSIYRSLSKRTNDTSADALNPDMESSDYGKARWWRIFKQWFGGIAPYAIGTVVAVGIFVVVMFSVWQHVFGLRGQRTFGVGHAAMAVVVPASAVVAPVPPVARLQPAPGGSVVVVAVPATGAPVPATVTVPVLPASPVVVAVAPGIGPVRAWSSVKLVTEKGVYHKGQEVDGWVLESWSLSSGSPVWRLLGKSK